jgi:hypothetical protein
MTSKAVLLVFAVSNLLPYSAHCAEIRIMCPGAYVDVLTELAPALELTTKHKVTIVRDGPTNILNRVRAGEAVDIIILPEDALNELFRDGYIANSGRRPLAKIQYRNGGSDGCSQAGHQLGRRAKTHPPRGEVDSILKSDQRPVSLDGVIPASWHR